MPVAESASTSATLGTEVRCRNMVMKTYDGKDKLKVCNALLAVVEIDVGGSCTVHTKCVKCKQMVHHALSK